MKRGHDWATVAKVIFGGLLIGAGGFLAFHTNKISTSKGYAVSIAHAQSGSGNSSAYTANWQASKLLAVDTSNLFIEFANTSPRDLFAIGPAQWTVTYKDSNGLTLATETWDAPTPPMCYNTTACNPSGANAHQYLFGLVAPANSAGVNTVYSSPAANYYKVVNWDDGNLFTATNPRFVGPGAVGETNVNTNTDGYWATGAYGWTAGKADGAGQTGGRDYTVAAGVMIPLQWNVTGTLFAN